MDRNRWFHTQPTVLPEAQGVDASGVVILDMVNNDVVRLQPLILRVAELTDGRDPSGIWVRTLAFDIWWSSSG
jgi:hypothetical protein